MVNPNQPISFLQELLLRPWMDRRAVGLLSRWFFPLSRAWAAGLEAGEDPAALARALGRDSVPEVIVTPALRALARRAKAHDEITALWERTLFLDPRPGDDLPVIESMRREAAHRLMAGRMLFIGLHLAAPVPPVRYAIADPVTVDAHHGARLADADHAFDLPAASPAWDRSVTLEGNGQRVFWLRAPAPVRSSNPDVLWCRVVEPTDRSIIGTLVFAHGIGMEEEHWRMLLTPVGELVKRGLRLLLPEGPGHGRRRVAGFYGGEPVMALAPLGWLDYLHAHVVELGLLIAWARGLDDGALPVAVGGVSLGALTAQLALSVAAGWPAQARPDAGFLVTPNRSVDDVIHSGALSAAVGLTKALDAAGWTVEDLSRWHPLLEPAGPPAVEPGRVIAVLGSADEVTPFAGGKGLVDDWGLPPQNVFIRPRGHFSSALALSMVHDPAPLDHLTTLLREAAPGA